MAIAPRISSVSQGVAQVVQPPDIDAWTEQAAQSLSALSVSAPSGARGTTVSLAIDIDEQVQAKENDPAQKAKSAYRSRRQPLRRDSMERREALLKGKEGSRRRTRWENDHLLSNPWAQPPLPSDWEIRPTYTQRSVPYFLAPLWDQGMAANAEMNRKRQIAARKRCQEHDVSQGAVPRDLREKLKKAKAAKGLLRDLEEQIRLFVNSLDQKARHTTEFEKDSEDEEIVFVGRNGRMHNVPSSPVFRDGMDDDVLESHRLVFESLADDKGANFGQVNVLQLRLFWLTQNHSRWLVHSIANYYGLRTWSRTVGDPARREAYVGIDPFEQSTISSLPRPLWGMV